MWRWMQRNLGSQSQTSSNNCEKTCKEKRQEQGWNDGLLQQAQVGVPSYPTMQRKFNATQRREKTNKNRTNKDKGLSPEEAATIIQKNYKAYKARKLVKGLRRLLEEERRTLSLTGKGGSHDMEALSAELQVATALCDMERLEKVVKRCSELQEILTQRTIAVDGIPHGENDFVRQQRKDTVKTILSLADKADNMKEQVENALDSIKN